MARDSLGTGRTFAEFPRGGEYLQQRNAGDQTRNELVARAVLVMSNRREERIPIHRPIEFTIQRAPNNYFDAIATDYCTGGIRLSTDRLLLTGDRITVIWGQRKLAGSVAYCNRDGNQFSVGVKLRQG